MDETLKLAVCALLTAGTVLAIWSNDQINISLYAVDELGVGYSLVEIISVENKTASRPATGTPHLPVGRPHRVLNRIFNLFGKLINPPDRPHTPAGRPHLPRGLLRHINKYEIVQGTVWDVKIKVNYQRPGGVEKTEKICTLKIWEEDNGTKEVEKSSCV